MHCPFCATADTKVVDSRLSPEGNKVRRRRECAGCSARFTTYEVAELAMPLVVKQDNRREAFNESKLRAGMLKALEKRPVEISQVEEAIQRIQDRARSRGERELSSRVLGDWMMAELRELDQIAYVRFASVYRSFQDLHAFRDEVEKLLASAATPIPDRNPD